MSRFPHHGCDYSSFLSRDRRRIKYSTRKMPQPMSRIVFSDIVALLSSNPLRDAGDHYPAATPWMNTLRN